MVENVKLITTENFENVPCDFYKNINNEYLMTREQIGTALGYSNPTNAIKNIHSKHKERLNQFSTWLTLSYREGERIVQREKIYYTCKGVMEICRWSRQPIADKFMDWCWDIIDTLIKKEFQKQSQIVNISSQLNTLLQENKYIKNKVSRLENLLFSLLPPTKHSQWKSEMAKKLEILRIHLVLTKQKLKVFTDLSIIR